MSNLLDPNNIPGPDRYSVGSPGIAHLSTAVARALERNPDLAVDAPGRQAAHLEFKAARAGYLPRLDFEQSYLAGNNPVFVFGTLLTQQKFGTKTLRSRRSTPGPDG